MTIAFRVLTALVAAVAAVAAVLVPAVARADPPGRLVAQVTDRAGVLGDGRAPADAALSRLRQDTGIRLFVVFVDSFDGVPAQRWTDETARLSGLGDEDALLAVATGAREYAYSPPHDSRISDGERIAVARNDIEPALVRGDWSGAVVGAADGYRAAATGSNQSLAWLSVLLGVIVAGALIWFFVRRRRPAPAFAPTAPTGPEPADPPTEELAAQADALLIELDDDLRTGERDLDRATARHGTDATRQFRAALEAARENLVEAFRLRTTLDAVPAPSEVAQRRTLNAVLTNCTSAARRLDAESEEFDRLLDRAPQLADETDERRVALEAALPPAALALQDLLSRYAGTTVTGVSANVDLARARLSFAAGATARARAALGTAAADDEPGSTVHDGKGGVPAGSASTHGPDADPRRPARPRSRRHGAGSSSAARRGRRGAGADRPTTPRGRPPGVSSTVPRVDPPDDAGAIEGPDDDRAEATLTIRAAARAVDQAERLIAAVHRADTDLEAARWSADALITGVEADIAAGRAAMTGDGTVSAGLGVAVASAAQVLIEVRAELAAVRPDPVAAVARLQAVGAELDQALTEVRDAADRSARARSLLIEALPVAGGAVAAASDFIAGRPGAIDAGARASLSEARRRIALAETLAVVDPVMAAAEARRAQRLATDASRSAHADAQSRTGADRA